MRVFITRKDLKLAGDCSQSVRLTNFPGLWFIWQRPQCDIFGRMSAVEIKPADKFAELQELMLLKSGAVA